MRSRSRAAALETVRANEAVSASKDLFRAVAAFMSMPARWACDFTSAFESVTRHDDCCDPCPPKCNDPCDDPCDSSSCCDPCSCHSGGCGCGGRGCSKCGSRRLEVGSWVEIGGGRVAVIVAIEDCFVTVRFRDDPEGRPQQYTKSSIRRVLQPPLGNNARVLTKLGLVGKIVDYKADARIVTLEVLGRQVEIDRCVICEILPDAPEEEEEEEEEEQRERPR